MSQFRDKATLRQAPRPQMRTLYCWVYTSDAGTVPAKIVFHDPAQICCEGCGAITNDYCQSWAQGERGAPASNPDTIVIYECLECLLCSRPEIRWTTNA